jgi:hypothetical protein
MDGSGAARGGTAPAGGRRVAGAAAPLVALASGR